MPTSLRAQGSKVLLSVVVLALVAACGGANDRNDASSPGSVDVAGLEGREKIAAAQQIAVTGQTLDTPSA